jgi:mannose-1-phosphate guanylyltransferase
MKIIVTAGGQGTKLWPYSRTDKPKQFQPIVGDKSAYQESIETLLQSFPAEDIFISTKHKFIRYVSEQSPQIPLKNYIVEPDIAKDRGPGEGLAFLRLSMEYPDEPFFVVQADCIRLPEEAFLDMITAAGKIVANNKKYITGGLKATEPNLGVDYLQLGEKAPDGCGQEVYNVTEFLGRRSSYRETKELIENFHIVTHCNHSCWYPDLMLDAYKQYRPDWHDALMKIREAIGKPGEDAAIEAIYSEMEKGATEEVTKNILKGSQIILLPFKWTDIGTWTSVYEFFETGDGKANYEDGKVITFDTTGSIIKSHSKEKLLAIAGVQDLIVIDTEDALLVIPKQKMEQIKDLQRLLAENDDRKYL